MTAKLSTFDAVREVQIDALLRHRLQMKKSDKYQRGLGLLLAESILDNVALKKYKVPLCFREIDDDLEVIYNEALNTLD